MVLNRKNFSLESVKTEIINYSLVIFLLIGVLAYALGLTRFYHSGFHYSFILEFLVLLAVLVITWFRKKLPNNLKASLVIVLIFLFALSDAIFYGIFSSARVYLILVPFYSLFYFSVRKTVVLFFLAMFSFLLVGYSYYTSYLKITDAYNPALYVARFYPWIINAIHISIVATIMLLITRKFIHTYYNLIFELQQSNRVVSESEEKYRTLMENINEVIMMVDNQDKVQYVNDNFIKILGYTREEIIGQIGYEKLLNPKDHDVIQKANDSRIEKQKSQYELSFYAKNGKKIDFLISGAPIVNANGITIGSIGAMIDITERKQAERELGKYQNQLELLVQERTEALEATNEELLSANEALISKQEELEKTLHDLEKTQEQLLHSEKMASLGVLAAGVAHEINNPLNFISGGVVGLEYYFQDHLQEHKNAVSPLLISIREGVKRATNIVTSLNHYSKTDNLPRHQCNLNSILDHCFVLLQSLHKDGIEIYKNYTPQPYTLLAKEGKLHQAFLNILTNAFEAIKDLGSITISTKIQQNKIITIITDTGCGIPKNKLSRIMDPFYSSKSHSKATGLGLSIAYNIIREHEGDIKIESKVGKGTRVMVSLPIQDY